MKFIFVQAIVNNKLEDPGSIRFEHCVVEASDESEVYTKGPRVIESRMRAAGTWYSPETETRNDYVIKLEGVT